MQLSGILDTSKSSDGVAAPVVLWMRTATDRQIVEASAHGKPARARGFSLAIGEAWATRENGRTQMRKPESASPSTWIPLIASVGQRLSESRKHKPSIHEEAGPRRDSPTSARGLPRHTWNERRATTRAALFAVGMRATVAFPRSDPCATGYTATGERLVFLRAVHVLCEAGQLVRFRRERGPTIHALGRFAHRADRSIHDYPPGAARW